MSKAREYALRRKYNLTLEQYNELLARQRSCCAICGRHVESLTRNLCVDHDHVTLELRGLLCDFCNRRVVGRHRDYTLFERAAAYLKGPYTGIFANKIKKKRRRKATLEPKNNNKRKRRT